MSSIPQKSVPITLAAIALLIGPLSAAVLPDQQDQAIDDPFELQKSQVYDVYGDWAVRGMEVHPESIRGMLNLGVQHLTGADDPTEAWQYFIHPNDVVALVFDRRGKDLGVNRAVAAALLQCLYQVGFGPENFMIVGLDDLPDEAQGTRPCRYGWQETQQNFASSSDHLAAWLDEVTAIINLPSITDDNILGLRSALANVTLPLLKCPARLYINHGDPFIPEIYSLPQIRGKVRLNIAIALRILYNGGPVVRQSYVYQHKALIFSTDPVALDRVAAELITRARRTLALPTNVPDEISAPYLQTAQTMGLGYHDLNFIAYHRLKYQPTKNQTP